MGSLNIHERLAQILKILYNSVPEIPSTDHKTVIEVHRK